MEQEHRHLARRANDRRHTGIAMPKAKDRIRKAICDERPDQTCTAGFNRKLKCETDYWIANPLKNMKP